MKTYRERIQDIYSRLSAIYDEAGYLRDCADWDEKDYWNDLRGLTSKAAVKMNQLDNNLPDNRAKMKV